MKVLVTGAGALLGQGIVKSLRASALKPTIVAVDPNPLSVGLIWADVAHLVPRANAPGYLERVEELLRRERPDALLVGTDVELAAFASQRPRLEQTYGTRVLVSSPEVVEIADDKWQTAQFFKERELDHPDSALPGDEERLIAGRGFPLLVKPRRGARSVGVEVVRSRAELSAAIERGGNVVIQEYVGSEETEYTAGVLCFEGRAQASIVMRRDLRDGNTYRAYVERYPELNRTVREWAEQLQPHGPANFQFRLDRDGRPKLFEINARFSGTTPLRALAGFNEVEMALRHVLLGEPIAQPDVVPMTILRYWQELTVPRESAQRSRGGC